jgi:hypothetical protein
MQTRTTVFGLLPLLALAAPAAAQTFPANNNQWTPFTCAEGGNPRPMTDAVADHNGAPGARDVVGNAPSPAGLRAADNNFLYLRLRLDDDPRMGVNLQPHAWGFAFGTLGPNGYQVLVTLDGRTAVVATRRNSQVAIPDSPLDPADSPPVGSHPYSSHSRVVEADSQLGGNRDFFLDLAVPWSDLATAGLGPSTTAVVWAASSTAADRLDLDFACHDAGGSARVPALVEAGSSAERVDPSGSGGSGPGGSGGRGGGTGGAGGIELEGGPGCALGGGPAGGACPWLLLALAGLLGRRRR